MECSTFERELLEQGYGLDLSLKARSHADSCKHCRFLMQSQQNLWEAVELEKQVPVPPFLSTRVLAGLQKKEVGIGPMPVWKQTLQIAAVLLALLGGYSASVMMEQRSAADDFSVVLSDYFLTGESGFSIEEGWLYSETYENE